MTQPTAGDSPAPNDASAARGGVDARAPDAGEHADGAIADAAEASRPPAAERPIPIGCHPFVFGVIAATIQLALTIFLMRSC